MGMGTQVQGGKGVDGVSVEEGVPHPEWSFLPSDWTAKTEWLPIDVMPLSTVAKHETAIKLLLLLPISLLSNTVMTIH